VITVSMDVHVRNSFVYASDATAGWPASFGGGGGDHRILDGTEPGEKQRGRPPRQHPLSATVASGLARRDRPISFLI